MDLLLAVQEELPPGDGGLASGRGKVPSSTVVSQCERDVRCIVSCPLRSSF